MNTQRLKKILRLARHHNSPGEIIMCRMLWRIPGIEAHISSTKSVSAYYLTIPKSDGTKYPVLWSAHTDSVHAHTDEVRQNILFDAEDMMFAASRGKAILGADDGAGLWLLWEMIEAGVPGTYVFHRGEEVGGIGSRSMEAEQEKWLEQFTHAIAFDRKGNEDVITHQGMGRCCSDAWAMQFAEMLGMGHKKSEHGIFTDTANYTSLIPECSNVGIGYEGAHSHKETLDLEYLFRLRDRMIEVFKDAPDMKVVRKVDDVEDYAMFYGQGWRRASTTAKRKPIDLYDVDEWDIVGMPILRLEQMCRMNPGAAADLLMDFAGKIVYQLELELDDEMEGLDEHASSHLKHGLA